MFMRISPQMFVLLLTALLLSACGYHLRGQSAIPFETLYLDAANPNTPLVKDLRRNLEASRVKLVDTADQATVVLNIVSEISEQQILSLGGDGRVNEYRLFYRVSLRAYDHQQQDWIPAEDISLRRDYTYDDSKLLAKDAEEAVLYQSMRSDMLQQILRRLNRAKPQPK
jgi:LPS-assembly lipoprotein